LGWTWNRKTGSQRSRSAVVKLASGVIRKVAHEGYELCNWQQHVLEKYQDKEKSTARLCAVRLNPGCFSIAEVLRTCWV
jgi:hypothetical protein